MGMFDTIHVDPPLVCPGCNGLRAELQTKEFGSTLENYRIGSVVPFCPVLSGIIKETLWCAECHNAGKGADSPVYLVLWHTVLVAVDQDLARAEMRLATVDRLDLIRWLETAQRESRRWRQRFHALRVDVRRWQEHLSRAARAERGETEATENNRHRFRVLFDLPAEILAAPDPLAAILDAHPPIEEP